MNQGERIRMKPASTMSLAPAASTMRERDLSNASREVKRLGSINIVGIEADKARFKAYALGLSLTTTEIRALKRRPWMARMIA